MRKLKLAVLMIMALITALVLSACGPEEDTTDDLLVSVDVPFSTSGVLSTPSTYQLSGWFGETVTINEGEYDTLRIDPVSIGENVRNLQTRLIELGYLSNEKNSAGNYRRVNGKYDAATKQAVEKFEAAYGQSPTGVADELMQYYLFSNGAKAYTASAYVTATPTTSPTALPAQSGYRYLQRGDSGDDVVALQQRLYYLGYLNYVSGSYDAATESAVNLFASAYGQNTNGGATVDLQKALFSSNAISYARMIASVTPTPSPTPTPDPYGGYTTLREGDKGAAVTRLQNRLRELGYMRSKADGIYGDRTVEAVMKFEAAYGRPETGIATAALQMYLFSDEALEYGAVTPTPAFSATPTPEASYSTLAVGSSGDQVLRLQLRLIELGYLAGGADGEYGNQTRLAVMAFEQAHGATATGVATAAMQQYLFSDGAKPNPTQTALTAGYTELSLGSQGQSVSNLQNRLRQLGYYDGEITGFFDGDTYEAVTRFEAEYGKTQTGIATSALQTVLYSQNAKAYTEPTPSVSYSTLKKGDRGEDVTRLQNRLKELGYLEGAVDGYYGEGTERAIRYFESAYGRAQTGVATSELQSYLYSSSARQNTTGNVAVSYSTLKSGDTGEAVTNLQKRLIALGYMSGSATGKYGTGTVNAVKSFQKLMGYTVNGAASSELQQKLFSSDAKNYSAEKVVSVNRQAKVKASSTQVYSSFYDDNPSFTISNGTEVTVTRTRGIWAEVQSSSGYVGYVMLSDLEYINSSATSTPAPSTVNRVSVNKNAIINKNGVTVYDGASTGAKKLGTLDSGYEVVWVATIGDWAEIKNKAGTMTGYVKTAQLTISSSSNSNSSNAAYQTLKNGSTGESVKTLQTRLKELGYHYGDIGGNYLTKTTDAVKRFQARIGLYPDGVATPGLQDILFSSYAPSYNISNATQRTLSDMYSGRSDLQVSDLQKQLVSLGYLSGVSGTYDSATIKAVTQVQTALGLKDAGGFASRELQAFLYTFGNQIKR